MLFIPHPLALWAIPVLQEMQETFTEATALVAEIGVRFKSGDPADELVARLDTLLAVLNRADLPSEMRSEINQLLTRVQEAIAAGNEWLDQTGPELAAQQLRQRVQRTYGVT